MNVGNGAKAGVRRYTDAMLVRLTVHDGFLVRELAAAQDMQQSDLLRQAVSDYIEKHWEKIPVAALLELEAAP